MAAIRCGHIRSCALYGIQGIVVDIEVSILPGLPSFEIVGLGDSTVRESRNRVHAAIKNSGFDFPVSRVIASYAPAWQRKEGSAFDLPLALAILMASGQLTASAAKLCVFGELSLTGEIRSVPGVICRVAACAENGIGSILVPTGNAAEASCAGAAEIRHAASLKEAVGVLAGERAVSQMPMPLTHQTVKAERRRDLSSIIGQEKAVRALQIAAAGRHNLLFLGSPGSGKTSLASMLPDLLPPLSPADAMQVTRIFSASGLLNEGDGLVTSRPFRMPHHSITRSAMIGGGPLPVPGEISLAHHGVLFLDEMTEFNPAVLDLLRQPMEENQVRLVRLHHKMTYPSDFMLVGAANPCRCGEFFEPNDLCRCSQESVRNHLGRLSGPLLDRIDLVVEMIRLPSQDMARCVTAGDRTGHKTDMLAETVSRSWSMQMARCREHQIPETPNGRIFGENLAYWLDIPSNVATYSARVSKELKLTVRGYQRLLRVARTIADLEGHEQVTNDHVSEAAQYRFHLPVRHAG